MNEHYKAVLADLKQMKADAEAGIAAIERLMSRTSPNQDEPEEIEDFHDYEEDKVPGIVSEAPPISVPQRVLEFLANHSGQTCTVEEIGEGTGADNIHTLRGALHRLSRDGKIGKYGRGRYRALRPKAQTQPDDA